MCRKGAPPPPPAPTPQSTGPQQQPRVKLRPLFWTKVPAKPGTVWAEISDQKALLSDAQMSVIEQLFPQAAAAVVAAKEPKQGGFCLGTYLAMWRESTKTC